MCIVQSEHPSLYYNYVSLFVVKEFHFDCLYDGMRVPVSRLLVSRSHLQAILFEMNKRLSEEEIAQLRQPLMQALGRMYDYYTVG